jgi:hypothetical protein
MNAFDLGSHGFVEPVTISNPNKINLTAYAVGTDQDLFVTVINKTHSSTNDVTSAVVTIQAGGFESGSADYMLLTDGEPGNAAMMTANLGGASITNHDEWKGKWTSLGHVTHGKVELTVESTTAAIVRIHAAGGSASWAKTKNKSLHLSSTGENHK